MRAGLIVSMVFVALGPVCASSVAATEPVTSAQLDRCLFGFDRGCRAGGLQTGLTVGQVDRGCSCGSGVLGKAEHREQVDTWCAAATRRLAKEETAALVPLQPELRQCFAPDAIDPVDSPPRPAPIVGTWTWTRQDNQCTETTTYRVDGTSVTTSGDEQTEDRWKLSDWLPASDSWRLTLTTTRDSGGRDCANRTADDTGSTVNVFVRFASDGQRMVVCYAEADNRCYGPLRRVGD